MRYALCKKDVIMEFTNKIAFNKGKEYEICRYDYHIDAIDNDGDEHGIGHYNDPWLHEHFMIIESLEEV